MHSGMPQPFNKIVSLFLESATQMTRMLHNILLPNSHNFDQKNAGFLLQSNFINFKMHKLNQISMTFILLYSWLKRKLAIS